MRSPLRLALLVALVLLTVGCLSGGPGAVGTPTPDGPTTESATATPMRSPGTTAPKECPPPEAGTPTVTPDTATVPGNGTPTATEPGFEFPPDRATPILLRNDWSESVEVRVRVVCEPSAVTVHDESYALGTGARLEVYDLTEASPDGRVPLRVVVSARDSTRTVTVKTTECADATARVGSAGDLEVWATC